MASLLCQGMIVSRFASAGPHRLHRPRFAAETARWARHLARDGAVLAGDLASGNLPRSLQSSSQPAITGPSPPSRRARQQLIAWMPNAELQVRDGASRPLYIQQPTAAPNGDNVSSPRPESRGP